MMDALLFQYLNSVENLIRDAVFNYASPVLKIKGEVNKQSLGKKLQWRGIRIFSFKCGKEIICVCQRGIIISRLMTYEYPNVFISKIDHPFFKKELKGKIEDIKIYLGIE